MKTFSKKKLTIENLAEAREGRSSIKGAREEAKIIT
jgi:hypothetical protein